MVGDGLEKSSEKGVSHRKRMLGRDPLARLARVSSVAEGGILCSLSLSLTLEISHPCIRF